MLGITQIRHVLSQRLIWLLATLLVSTVHADNLQSKSHADSLQEVRANAPGTALIRDGVQGQGQYFGTLNRSVNQAAGLVQCCKFNKP